MMTQRFSSVNFHLDGGCTAHRQPLITGLADQAAHTRGRPALGHDRGRGRGLGEEKSIDRSICLSMTCLCSRIINAPAAAAAAEDDVYLCLFFHASDKHADYYFQFAFYSKQAAFHFLPSNENHMLLLPLTVTCFFFSFFFYER